jgi:hypothetical protein
MTPMQQILLGVGASKKTYMDDVFSTYLYTGNGGANQIVNGIDNTEESMIWFKNRTDTSYPQIHDTIRGGQNWLLTSESNAAGTDSGYHINTFNNNGFTLQNSGGGTNANNKNFVSWNFKSASGFFDVVTYTGNGTSGRAISHSLGSIPGCIMVKCTSDDSNWRVYHRGNGTSSVPAEHWALSLNQNAQAADGPQYFNDTLPTSTHFTVGNSVNVNDNAKTYVAYLFGGGQSTSSEARSVEFDGASDHMRLSLAASTDLDMGTGDFTIEFWYKGKNTTTSSRQAILASNTTWQSGFTQIQVNHPSHINHIVLWDYDINSSNPVIKSTNAFPSNGTWRHVALARSSGTLRLFVNGTLEKSVSQSGSLDFSDGNGTLIGYNPSDTGLIANISNLRVVKGTAVYTSSFRPPTEPLTNITNTKLLCCNNSSTTGSTVTPGTITAHASPIASSDAPFDDPAGFVFGDSKEGIIKCGSYTGNGSSTGPEINLGWEPQWVMVKRTDSGGSWLMLDTMRAWTVEGEVDAYMYANATDAESVHQWGAPTNTGMQMDGTDGTTNASGGSYIYLAIRRPDGYVGKPASAATDVFAIDTGNSSSTIPAFDSGFTVDFGIKRSPASTADWIASTRLTGLKVVKTNSTDAQSTSTTFVYDSNVGYAKSQDSNDQGFMWKRHAGFDVVTYKGNGTFGHIVNHSMNKIPEMIWIKERDNAVNWYVNHIALTGGGSYASWRGAIKLNSSAAAWESANILGGASTSSTFTVGGDNDANQNGDNYLALLFASVDGISKVGSYTGNGSTTGPVITTGFAPRLIMIKRSSGDGDWYILDTVRGLSSSSNKLLKLNDEDAQSTPSEVYVEPSSTGFQLKVGYLHYNYNNEKYIYYAHA